jgi:cytochrome c oxidase subunit 2
VIHSFFVPAFRVKQDVLPGRFVTMWFQASQVGRFHLFCTEYCGTGHSTMIGSVVVMEPADYEAWLAQRAEGSLALEGRKMFLQLQCITCHSGNAQAPAPLLEDIYGKRIPLADGTTVLANDDYLRESILEPNAKVVAGFQPIMPSYQENFMEDGKVREDKLLPLIVYLQSLRRGETPTRVEETPPPIGAKKFTPAGPQP